MAEYLIREESLIAIANGVRELSGETGAMGLNGMVSGLNDANAEVNSQSNLLAQIVTALDGKTAGGINIETCTITVESPEAFNVNVVLLSGGGIITDVYEGITSEIINDVVKNSIVFVTSSYPTYYSEISIEDGTLLYFDGAGDYSQVAFAFIAEGNNVSFSIS